MPVFIQQKDLNIKGYSYLDSAWIAACTRAELSIPVDLLSHWFILVPFWFNVNEEHNMTQLEYLNCSSPRSEVCSGVQSARRLIPWCRRNGANQPVPCRRGSGESTSRMLTCPKRYRLTPPPPPPPHHHTLLRHVQINIKLWKRRIHDI